ncbi:MAG: WecB/TagA/CpsF family glycosyltransferase [bacterium]|nr:WecB/TagA/CpsF family glycosyltransferase [bacterium]
MKSSAQFPLLLNCSFFSRREYLEKIQQALGKDTLTHIVTLNAEMIVEAQTNQQFRDAVERAELKIPDGGSLLWAREYLEERHAQRCTHRHPGLRAGIRACPPDWRVAMSGFRIKSGMTNYALMILSLIKFLFSKQQPLTGVDSIYDICEAVQHKNGSVYLLGGTHKEAQGTADVLQKKYPKLIISIIHDSTPPSLPFSRGGVGFSQQQKLIQLTKLVKLKAPIALFVALGSPKQTLYIEQHRKMLEEAGIRIAIGVGGAFAMISGILPRAPKFMRRHHLEWLWRLILEPKRIKRIWNAVFVFPNIIRGYPH